MLYVNLEGDSAYTEEELEQAYDSDVAQLVAYDPGAQRPTYDEWLEEQRDLGPRLTSTTT